MVVPAQESTARSSDTLPVVYAGRCDVAAAQLDATVFDDRQALPTVLVSALEEAPLLVILDPLSFPFESLGEQGWATPMVIVVPESSPPGLLSVVEAAHLRQAGPLDRWVVAASLWPGLRDRLGLSERHRLDAEPGDAGSVLRAARAWLQSEEGDSAGSVGREKARLRRESAAIEARIDAALDRQPLSRGFATLVVASGAERFLGVCARRAQRAAAVELDESSGRSTAEGFPAVDVHLLPEHLRLPWPPESFDWALLGEACLHRPPHERRRLMSEVHRALRPGGALTLLARVVPSSDPDAGAALGVGELLDTVNQATHRRVVLDHVESVRYPGEERYSSGLIACTKVGPPTVW